jgi:hypothetical protein
MLNKGAHVCQAVGVFDDILRRMQTLVTKKRSMLRELKVAGRFRRGRPIPARRADPQDRSTSSFPAPAVGSLLAQDFGQDRPEGGAAARQRGQEAQDGTALHEIGEGFAP